MITVTEKAKAKAIELMTAENKPGEAFIRVGVEGGGESGASSAMMKDAMQRKMTRGCHAMLSNIFLRRCSKVGGEIR